MSSLAQRSAAEIEAWLVTRIAKLLETEAGKIDPAQPIVRYGLDSVQWICLITDLESWLGLKFTENPLPEHPTIDALSHYLAARSQGST